VYLRALPALLVLALAVLGALAHRPLVARVADLATFYVVRTVLEGAVLSVLVNFGGALPTVGDDQVDLRLLAAHQGTKHFFNDAVIGESLEAGWYPHG